MKVRRLRNGSACRGEWGLVLSIAMQGLGPILLNEYKWTAYQHGRDHRDIDEVVNDNAVILLANPHPPAYFAKSAAAVLTGIRFFVKEPTGAQRAGRPLLRHAATAGKLG